MPYWQLFYHLIWATKHGEPLITPAVASDIYGFLRGKAIGLGATVFAVNGVADHVHLIVAILPKIAVATLVGQIKGVASAKVNKAGLARTLFYWQEEYGAFSFDGKRLPILSSTSSVSHSITPIVQPFVFWKAPRIKRTG